MIEHDTIRLLRECDAGISMGVSSIRDVLTRVEAPGLHLALTNSMAAHERLKEELGGMLERCHDDGKAPNPLAKQMSWLKTNVKLARQPGDASIAELMTGGCAMGIQSLSRYLEQYKAASEDAKDIAERLIGLERALTVDMRAYL